MRSKEILSNPGKFHSFVAKSDRYCCFASKQDRSKRKHFFFSESNIYAELTFGLDFYLSNTSMINKRRRWIIIKVNSMSGKLVLHLS